MKIERRPLLNIKFEEGDLIVTEVYHPQYGMPKVKEAQLTPAAIECLAEFIKRESSRENNCDGMANEILKKKQEFFSRYHLTPGIVYLGEKESFQLDMDFMQAGFSEGMKKTVYGMTVIAVGKVSHIGFGI